MRRLSYHIRAGESGDPKGSVTSRSIHISTLLRLDFIPSQNAWGSGRFSDGVLAQRIRIKCYEEAD